MPALITHPIPYISGPDEISNEEYHRGEKYIDFISSTRLKYYLISPKYYQYATTDPEEIKIGLAASMEGSVYHDMLASMANHGNMDGFERNWFVFDPPINPRTGNAYGIDTKAYQEKYFEAMELNPGKEITSEAEIVKSKKMINELLYNNHHYSYTIRQLLDWGDAEQSFFCEHKGGKFKFRTDLMTRTKIIDWKTTAEKDLKENTIAKIILKFNYHISASFYQYFNWVITGKWKPFYWVFQQKIPPYDAVIVSADNWSYEIEKDPKGDIAIPRSGAIEFKKLLDQHLWCLKEDIYPGVSVFVEPDYRRQRIMYPEVPGWKKGELYDFYND